MMNALQVKTLKFEPAVVEFNYEELLSHLNESLKKYEGLTFTEDTLAEGKSTVAELRKGKKAVDEYRKSTKSKLTESVTAFENQCKELNKRFDSVIDPLVEQVNSFEQKRKEEKTAEVQSLINNLINEYDLESSFARELVIEDSYLNKTKSLESINDELKLKAQSLKAQQDTHEASKEVIASTVEITNERLGVNLTSAAYVRLLEYQSVQEIKTRITDDAHQIKADQEKKVVKPEPVVEATPAPEPVESEPIYFEVYTVTGTKSELMALEQFMKSRGIQFEIKEEMAS